MDILSNTQIILTQIEKSESGCCFTVLIANGDGSFNMKKLEGESTNAVLDILLKNS